MWGPDIPPAGLTGESALRQLLGALAGFAVLGVYIKYFGIPDRPAVPREFPYDGLVKELGGVEAIKVGKQLDNGPWHRLTTSAGKSGASRIVRSSSCGSVYSAMDWGYETARADNIESSMAQW